MNNFCFDITAEGQEPLLAAIKLVFGIARCDGTSPRGEQRGVTHYEIRDADGERPFRLIFFNHYDLKPQSGLKVALPFKLDAAGAADFARRWLAAIEYGPEPDIDGDVAKGWRLYNEAWGHIDEDNAAVIAVTPVWAMYGK